MMQLEGTDAFMTSANWFDSQTILDGIRRWVEIETPTDTPEQVNKLMSLVAEQHRDLPVTLERVAGIDGCGDHLIARSAWGRISQASWSSAISIRFTPWASSSACRSRLKATAHSVPASTT
ncbi:hypothetical protein ACVWY3_006094 [Bradyrhizobium sp. USDA 4486]